MGRRALRQVDPSLDLSHHLKTFADLPQPWDAAVLFDRNAPLEVEIGSGKGLFLQSAAVKMPHHDFLGIEVSQKYARFTAARLTRRRLENAVVVNGDALRIFHEVLPPECAQAVHVYFPDPWWKKRHRRRRVMQPAFLQDVERVLTFCGRLHFWTDVHDYYQETLAFIAGHTSLFGPIAVPEEPAEHELDYRTHFERRMRLNEEPVYRVEFTKRAEGSARRGAE